MSPQETYAKMEQLLKDCDFGVDITWQDGQGWQVQSYLWGRSVSKYGSDLPATVNALVMEVHRQRKAIDEQLGRRKAGG